MKTTEIASVITRQTPYDDLPERLTVDEFAAAAGVSRASAFQYAKTGSVPVLRFGKRIVVRKSALLVRA